MADDNNNKPFMDPRGLVRQTTGDVNREPSYQTDYATGLANKYGLYVQIQGIHANSSVAFRAFLTNFNESFTSHLKSENLVGHYEPLRKVTGIERIVSVGLSLPTFNLEDAMKNLNEVKSMTNLLYPRTSTVPAGETGYVKQKYVKSAGDPIFRVKFANLIIDSKATAGDIESINAQSISTSGQKGYIDGFNYEFGIEEGFYVLPNGFTYPKLINLSFNFYPLHEVSPSWTSRNHFDHKNLPYAIQSEGWKESLVGTGGDGFEIPSVDDAGASGLDSAPAPIRDAEGNLLLGQKVLK